MPKVLVWGALLTTLALVAPGATAQVKDLPWKMAVVQTDGGKQVSLPFNRPLSLKNGNHFFLVIIPEANGFLDVLYEDADGVLQQTMFSGPAKDGSPVILPSETEAFEVTPPNGTEKLHVVFSAKPVASLRSLYKGLPGTSAKLLDALAAYKTSLSSLAEAPEKPAPMGGTHRGLTDATMTEFRGKDAYVKTIRFDH
jgi:hypothetical protein